MFRGDFMTDATTCILVAGESTGAFYDSCQGTSHLRHVTRRRRASGVSADEARHSFALRLASGFYYDVQNRLYDGLIILATPEMLEAVKDGLPPEMRNLLIAAISYSDAAAMEIPDGSWRPLPQRTLQ
jgi:hypothetical protein